MNFNRAILHLVENIKGDMYYTDGQIRILKCIFLSYNKSAEQFIAISVTKECMLMFYIDKKDCKQADALIYEIEETEDDILYLVYRKGSGTIGKMSKDMEVQDDYVRIDSAVFDTYGNAQDVKVTGNGKPIPNIKTFFQHSEEGIYAKPESFCKEIEKEKSLNIPRKLLVQKNLLLVGRGNDPYEPLCMVDESKANDISFLEGRMIDFSSWQTTAPIFGFCLPKQNGKNVNGNYYVDIIVSSGKGKLLCYEDKG